MKSQIWEKLALMSLGLIGLSIQHVINLIFVSTYSNDLAFFGLYRVASSTWAYVPTTWFWPRFAPPPPSSTSRPSRSVISSVTQWTCLILQRFTLWRGQRRLEILLCWPLVSIIMLYSEISIFLLSNCLIGLQQNVNKTDIEISLY